MSSNVQAIVTCIHVKILFLMFVDQPSWTMHIQVMTFEEAEKFRWNPFDLTKVKSCLSVMSYSTQVSF